MLAVRNQSNQEEAITASPFNDKTTAQKRDEGILHQASTLYVNAILQERPSGMLFSDRHLGEWPGIGIDFQPLFPRLRSPFMVGRVGPFVVRIELTYPRVTGR